MAKTVQEIHVGALRMKRATKFGPCDMCQAVKAGRPSKQGGVRPATWSVLLANWPAGRVCTKHAHEWEAMWLRGGTEEEVADAA